VDTLTVILVVVGMLLVVTLGGLGIWAVWRGHRDQWARLGPEQRRAGLIGAASALLGLALLGLGSA